MIRQREIDQYLKCYPEVLKWLNECPLCHRRGYRPDMPERICGMYSVAGKHIRSYFEMMETDEIGLCATCSRLQKSNGYNNG